MPNAYSYPTELAEQKNESAVPATVPTEGTDTQREIALLTAKIGNINEYISFKRSKKMDVTAIAQDLANQDNLSSKAINSIFKDYAEILKNEKNKLSGRYIIGTIKIICGLFLPVVTDNYFYGILIITGAILLSRASTQETNLKNSIAEFSEDISFEENQPSGDIVNKQPSMPTATAAPQQMAGNGALDALYEAFTQSSEKIEREVFNLSTLYPDINKYILDKINANFSKEVILGQFLDTSVSKEAVLKVFDNFTGYLKTESNKEYGRMAVGGVMTVIGIFGCTLLSDSDDGTAIGLIVILPLGIWVLIAAIIKLKKYNTFLNNAFNS